MYEPTHLDLFSGIGGFSRAFESAGFRTIGFAEIHPSCCTVLRLRWPSVRNYGDMRTLLNEELPPPIVITAGDPCPKHSRARSNGDSKSPDLSGFVLALVGRFGPRWVVRENVPAPTVEHFDAALEALGYGTVIIRTDAGPITGQTRQRDFIVGCRETTSDSLRKIFSFCENGPGTYATNLGTRQVISCLTTHRTRYDSRDCFIYEPDRIRILDAEEREAFAGFPKGWTHGFSEAARARFYGNAVVPAVVEPIARAIYGALK